MNTKKNFLKHVTICRVINGNKNNPKYIETSSYKIDKNIFKVQVDDDNTNAKGADEVFRLEDKSSTKNVEYIEEVIEIPDSEGSIISIDDEDPATDDTEYINEHYNEVIEINSSQESTQNIDIDDIQEILEQNDLTSAEELQLNELIDITNSQDTLKANDGKKPNTTECLKEFDDILEGFNKDITEACTSLEDIEEVINNINDDPKEYFFEIPRFDLQELIQSISSNELQADGTDDPTNTTTEPMEIDGAMELVDEVIRDTIEVYLVLDQEDIISSRCDASQDQISMFNEHVSSINETKDNNNKNEPKNVENDVAIINDENMSLIDELKTVTDENDKLNKLKINEVAIDNTEDITDRNEFEELKSNEVAQNHESVNKNDELDGSKNIIVDFDTNEIKEVKNIEVVQKHDELDKSRKRNRKENETKEVNIGEVEQTHVGLDKEYDELNKSIDSDDCGYQSSDFEFITEEEAKLDGLIINFNPKTHMKNKTNITKPKKVKTIEITIDLFSADERRDISNPNQSYKTHIPQNADKNPECDTFPHANTGNGVKIIQPNVFEITKRFNQDNCLKGNTTSLRNIRIHPKVSTQEITKSPNENRLIEVDCIQNNNLLEITYSGPSDIERSNLDMYNFESNLQDCPLNTFKHSTDAQKDDIIGFNDLGYAPNNSQGKNPPINPCPSNLMLGNSVSQSPGPSYVENDLGWPSHSQDARPCFKTPDNSYEKWRAFRNKQKNQFVLDRSYRERHDVLSGDEYFKLFDPNFRLPQICRQMENKSTVNMSMMLVEYEGIGFDMQMLRESSESEEEEVKEEAVESAQKILDMYPAENRKRRRRF